MPLALARKYRPKSFAAVAVQSHVSTTLKGAIAHDRVANAYLFCGPRGTGKTTLARVLAMALNCEHRATRTDGEPCGECLSCRRIWSGSASLDVVEIDAASNRGVDDARELRERAMYAPSTSERYKVYIIDEAHMLTRDAWNALLKVLEEPPPHVVFVFATTEPQKIAQAAAPALSRLQRFDLRRIGVADIRKRLRDVLTAEGVGADDEALALLARAADGSMRDALSLLDQVLSLDDAGMVTAARVREALGLVPDDEYLALLQIIADHRAGEVFSTVARLADAGVDFTIFLAGFADVIRAQLATVLGIESPELGETTRKALERHRTTWSAGDLLRMLQMITELEPRFRRSAQPQLLLEMLLVQCAMLDRAVDIEELLRSLGDRSSAPPVAGGTAGSGGAPAGTGSGIGRGSAGSGGVGSSGAGGRRATGAPDASAGVQQPPPRPPSGSDGGPASRATTRVEPRAESRLEGNTAAPPTVASRAEPVTSEARRPDPRAAAGSASDARGGRRPLDEGWPEIVDRVRHGNQAATLALALEQSVPEWGPSRGTVTVRLAEPNEFLARAIDAGRGDLLALMQAEWPDVERITVAVPEERAAGGPPRRLTVEAVRADQVASLRKRDAVLGAAIDALDLELME